MRILVLSDSHGNDQSIARAMDAQPQAAALLFLGDGERDLDLARALNPKLPICAVQGNCDWGSQLSYEERMVFASKTFFFTHGHTYYVKHGLSQFLSAARCAGANVALYGHTHEPYVGYEDGLYIMNPGSVSGSRTGKATYGYVDITAAGIVCNIVEVNRYDR